MFIGSEPVPSEVVRRETEEEMEAQVILETFSTLRCTFLLGLRAVSLATSKATADASVESDERKRVFINEQRKLYLFFTRSE